MANTTVHGYVVTYDEMSIVLHALQNAKFDADEKAIDAANAGYDDLSQEFARYAANFEFFHNKFSEADSSEWREVNV